MTDFVRRDALGRRLWRAEGDTPENRLADLGLEDPQEPELFELARAGQVPAQELSSHDRRLLVHGLWERRWSDTRIAVWTGLSVAHTARLRAGLGLAPHISFPTTYLIG